MNKLHILLVIIGLYFIYSVLTSGLRENMGSDFFHRGKLADISQHIQKQVAEARARYGMDKKEDFALLAELDKDYKQDLKLNMKEEPLEKYDPNRYVISEYAFEALKPNTNKSLDEVQAGMLASEDFAEPVDNAPKPLADYLEVDKYDAGSGNMEDLKSAYKVIKRDNYFQTLNALRVRGGNVYLYPTKECNPKGGCDVNGFK